MLNIFISILGIALTIFFIVGVHEFGHFIVARMLGIKVLRFSIGFGKTLLRFHDKKGTEYVFAAIPLGGYVKMLDETEENVPENELPLAYNRQPMYKKIAVVIAGPLTNLIFAFILYWLLFVIGFTSIAPVIGNVLPNTIAASAGLKPQEEILRIDSQTTNNWTSIVIRLMSYFGENKNIQIETKKLNSNTTNTYTVPLANWHMDQLKPDPLASLGIVPYEPEIPAIIGEILPDSPAAKSSLKVGDQIQSIGNQATKDWIKVLEIISKHPADTLTFTILREKKILTMPVTIGYKTDLMFKKHGYLGLSPEFHWPNELLRQNQYGPLPALSHAMQNTLDFTRLNFLLMGKILTGKVSLQSLGGPITIFESAGNALNTGLLSFVSFLAFLSIAIGVINILPIPGLDGGHLLFHFIELVTRRPLSQNAQALFYRLGLIFLVVLFIQALTNDIMRL